MLKNIKKEHRGAIELHNSVSKVIMDITIDNQCIRKNTFATRSVFVQFEGCQTTFSW